MKLTAKQRNVVGKKVKSMRQSGVVPASIFGPNTPNMNLEVDKKEFIKIFKENGFNNFFDLEIEGVGKRKVLIKDVQLQPATDKVLSIGFYQVDEERKITVEVPITFIGEAPVVKLNLGFLIVQMETIALYCLPKDLPNHIEVDLSKLENISDTILVSSISLPEGVDLDSNIDPDSAIVYVGTSQKEEAQQATSTEQTTDTASTSGEANSEKSKAE